MLLGCGTGRDWTEYAGDWNTFGRSIWRQRRKAVFQTKALTALHKVIVPLQDVVKVKIDSEQNTDVLGTLPQGLQLSQSLFELHHTVSAKDSRHLLLLNCEEVYLNYQALCT
ncbi:hypothetical protein chiPu_0007890 [Chiloscyllium punctatum]|uniref:Uncharacterized protein n=1 Tax=Chiloscyllium punctatum TaxID=137246 RepID=A0A401SGB8_CHIPU|nr:hypothetical protein [Chiloscyllium punctatum]